MKNITVQQINDPQKQAAFVASCDLSFEKRVDDAIEEIASLPSLRLLGLTGPTCSGKTTAAKKLTASLEEHGHRVHVVSIDDFYFDKSVLQLRADNDPNIEIDYDSEDTIDVALLEEKTASLLRGNETRMPRFDFRSGVRTEGVTLTPRAEDVFLFEGIQILYPKVDRILSGEVYRSIYICPSSSIEVAGECFTPNEIRLMRRLVRDHRYRASDPAFTLYLWQSVRENEEKSIFPNANRCHATIDSTMPYEIGMLKPHLLQLLSTIPSENPFFGQAQTMLKKLSAVVEIPSEYLTENSIYKEFI